MKVMEVNNENFDMEVLKSSLKVLVDFYANWCGPCRMLKPIIEEFADGNEDIKVVSLNVDKDNEIAAKYNITSIPCLILFGNGKELKRNIGLISKEDIEILVGD